jgi:hypothetical protein
MHAAFAAQATHMVHMKTHAAEENFTSGALLQSCDVDDCHHSISEKSQPPSVRR